MTPDPRSFQAGKPEVNAWAIRTRHFHAREQTLDSYACALEAKRAAEHLRNITTSSSEPAGGEYHEPQC